MSRAAVAPKLARRGVVRGAVAAWSEGGVRLLASRAARRGAETAERAWDAVAVAAAAREVARRRPETLDGALEFALTFEYAGVAIRPMQVASELRSFLELLATDPPQAVVEIGTGRGGTLFLLGHVARETATLVSIDAPESHDFAGRALYKRRARLYRSFARGRQRIEYIAADSHFPATLEHVSQILGRQPIDLLFVDGDHTLEGVAEDFRMYSPLVRRGGIVAFHDIVSGPPAAVGGVPEFWRSVRDERSLELVADWTQGHAGIGVLRV